MSRNEQRRISVTHPTPTSVETHGTVEALGFELRLEVRDAANISDAENLLEQLVQYFLSTPKTLSPGQTVDWASSLLVAEQTSVGCLAFGEMDLDGQTIIPTVDRAVVLWTEQSKLCTAHHTHLCPTRFGHSIAVSPHVLDGFQRIEGIRYAPAGTISGWWLYTEDYDGSKDDFKSMRQTHVFEVLRHRLDLAKYLGLPTGFAFRGFDPESVWFEPVEK